MEPTAPTNRSPPRLIAMTLAPERTAAENGYSRQLSAAVRAIVELAYQIVGDRRRNKSLKLAGFASDLADRSCLVAWY